MGFCDRTQRYIGHGSVRKENCDAICYCHPYANNNLAAYKNRRVRASQGSYASVVDNSFMIISFLSTQGLRFDQSVYLKIFLLPCQKEIGYMQRP